MRAHITRRSHNLKVMLTQHEIRTGALDLRSSAGICVRIMPKACVRVHELHACAKSFGRTYVVLCVANQVDITALLASIAATVSSLTGHCT